MNNGLEFLRERNLLKGNESQFHIRVDDGVVIELSNLLNNFETFLKEKEVKIAHKAPSEATSSKIDIDKTTF